LNVTKPDLKTFIDWQRQGLQVTSLRVWFGKYFQCIPIELLPSNQTECELIFDIRRLQDRWRLKRVLDLVFLIPYIGFMSILIALHAILLTLRYPLGLRLRKPVLFSSRCMGIDGKTFNKYAFNPANKLLQPFQGCPQIWNIWKGEMSFVGPRPLSPEVQQMLETSNSYYRLRLRILPGLTSWGRIHTSSWSNLDFSRIELQRDLFYIRNGDSSFDLWILLKASFKACRDYWAALFS